jgi:hypothetical protein
MLCQSHQFYDPCLIFRSPCSEAMSTHASLAKITLVFCLAHTWLVSAPYVNVDMPSPRSSRPASGNYTLSRTISTIKSKYSLQPLLPILIGIYLSTKIYSNIFVLGQVIVVGGSTKQEAKYPIAQLESRAPTSGGSYTGRTRLR